MEYFDIEWHDAAQKIVLHALFNKKRFENMWIKIMDVERLNKCI